MASNRSRTATVLLLYTILFFGAWTAWVLFLYPRMQSLGDRTFAYAAVNIGTRLLLWIAPILVLVRYHDGRNPWEYLGFVNHRQRGLLIGLLVSVLNFIGSWARFGTPDPALSAIGWNTILGTSFAVGFIEEVPFRGFLQQKLEELVSPLVANLLASLLFLAIHMPGWLLLGTFRLQNAVTVFVIGVVLGAVFKWSGSLWSPIVAHSSNDFFSVVLFRH